jgi:hypothetical protein
MLTLFLPLAPNPVMGGHLVHLPEDRVMDVEMTVEEGLQTIVTSGVAMGGDDDADDGLSAAKLESLTTTGRASAPGGPAPSADADTTDAQAGRIDRQARTARYDDDVSPEHTTTPDELARRERTAAEDAAGPRAPPATRTRDPADREETTRPPAEIADRAASRRDPTRRPPATVRSDEERPVGVAADDSDALGPTPDADDTVAGPGRNPTIDIDPGPFDVGANGGRDRKTQDGGGPDPSA